MMDKQTPLMFRNSFSLLPRLDVVFHQLDADFLSCSAVWSLALLQNDVPLPWYLMLVTVQCNVSMSCVFECVVFPFSQIQLISTRPSLPSIPFLIRLNPARVSTRAYSDH